MKINTPKLNFNNLEEKLPKILLGVFVVVGVSIVIFVYFLFSQGPDPATVESTQKELDSYNIKFDKKQIQSLFTSSPKPLKIDPNTTGSKNPFLHY